MIYVLRSNFLEYRVIDHRLACLTVKNVPKGYATLDFPQITQANPATPYS